MKAYLKQHRQSPRKVRLIVDFVRGKDVSRVLTELEFTTKKAASTMHKLISSAVDNAKQAGANTDNLYIEKITVDEGPTLFRFRARSRGRGARIRKRTSNIKVKLSQR